MLCITYHELELIFGPVTPYIGSGVKVWVGVVIKNHTQIVKFNQIFSWHTVYGLL
jgi:hypothetical protein